MRDDTGYVTLPVAIFSGALIILNNYLMASFPDYQLDVCFRQRDRHSLQHGDHLALRGRSSGANRLRSTASEARRQRFRPTLRTLADAHRDGGPAAPSLNAVQRAVHLDTEIRPNPGPGDANPPPLSLELVETAFHMLEQPDSTVSGVASLFGINRRTLAIYRDQRTATYRLKIPGHLLLKVTG